ncbi:hypothetical protein PIB30_062150 [Stylosanthes scabra]|uniref:Uncharacterized protein n=1 Tax=Stylosanthes scabra TaxID=79078 RepID=A0ABU6TLR5_9FABA|nr:hypothetical protein [Stylosanthes scabra]
MVLYLLRVCTKLHLGSPRFERNVFLSQEGEQHYRFRVRLVCEEEGINLEAHGCFNADEGTARDDAAYTLLEMLLMRTGHSICNYNYRRMCVLQQQLEEMLDIWISVLGLVGCFVFYGFGIAEVATTGNKRSDEEENERTSEGKGRLELPTIIEDEVSGVDNQVVGFQHDIKEVFQANHELVLSMLHDNASLVGTVKTILGQQGKVLEVLAYRVVILEGIKKCSSKGSGAAQKAATSLAEGKLPTSERRPLKRKLDFVDLTDDDTAILYLIRQQGIGTPFAFYHHKGLVMLGEETPKCLDLLFIPPEGMRFDGDDLVVAIFIFASGMEERLVEDSHCDGNRKRLLSLLPGAQLFDDVINMVVGMCTSHMEISMSWWLPTTFSPIDKSTRMCIAVQLVVGPHNPFAESVTEKAVKFWNSEMVRNYKKEAAGAPILASPSRSNSPTI